MWNFDGFPFLAYAKILFFRVLGMWQFIGGFLAGFLPNSTCYLLMRVLTYCGSKHLTRLWSWPIYLIWAKPKRFKRKKTICSKMFDNVWLLASSSCKHWESCLIFLKIFAYDRHPFSLYVAWDIDLASMWIFPLI